MVDARIDESVPPDERRLKKINILAQALQNLGAVVYWQGRGAGIEDPPAALLQCSGALEECGFNGDFALTARRLICMNCARDSPVLTNGECHDCSSKTEAAWRRRMDARQDPAQFEMKRLVGLLLTQHWMHECKIIPDYMPPYPRPETRPTCQVCYVYEGGTETFLRFSNGPLQGYFWDVYGEDMHSPELALIAIANAPPPPRVHAVIPTHGEP